MIFVISSVIYNMHQSNYNILLSTELNICQDYKNLLSIDKIYKKYDISKKWIERILLKNNIQLRNFTDSRNRKHSFDRSFFKAIDNELKAYWLGFLYADGCIAEYGVNLCLSFSDKEILEKFKEDISFTGNIEETNYIINYGEKYGSKPSHMAKLRIHSIEIKNDLIKLGCSSRKTLTLKFPTTEQVPEHLLNHFIRGYFDGDGSIWECKVPDKRKNKFRTRRFLCSIVSTDDFNNSLKIFLENKLNLLPLYLRGHAKTKGICYLSLFAFVSVNKFKNFIYNNATRFLKRKKDMFDLIPLEKSPTLEEKRYRIIKDWIIKNKIKTFTKKDCIDILQCETTAFSLIAKRLKSENLIQSHLLNKFSYYSVL